MPGKVFNSSSGVCFVQEFEYRSMRDDPESRRSSRRSGFPVRTLSPPGTD
jgi:hypothetical protein